MKTKNLLLSGRSQIARYLGNSIIVKFLYRGVNILLGKKSEQRDLNPRPTAPKAVALAKLRYAPIMCRNFKYMSY